MDIDASEQRIYRHAFGSIKGLTLTSADQLLQLCGSEERFFTMKERDLKALAGFNNRILTDDFRAAAVDKARREEEYDDAHNIHRLYFRDPDYPQRLLDCDDAPLLLYALGNCDLNKMRVVSIVGTRRATTYGVNFVNRLIEELAAEVSEPIAIVSGLAYGIDIAAHRAALANGLPTVAVVAHGLNQIYPAAHRSSAADIVRRDGALLTEYSSADPIHRGNFLARNRIVAGICDALVVVESADKGGALVTARIADAYSREVFALPGRTSDPYSAGCNRLIATHSATLIRDAADLIDQIGLQRAPKEPGTQQSLFPELNQEESLIVQYLEQHPDSHINMISTTLNITHSRLNALLIELEFKGCVLRKPGGFYSLA